MDRVLLQQAVSLFNTAEKWEAFLQLSNQKENIRKALVRPLVDKANQQFMQQPEGWQFVRKSSDEISMSWFLAAHGPNSILLTLGWGGQFVVEVIGGKHNTEMAAKLLETQDFRPLVSAFGRVDNFGNDTYLLEQRYDFQFGSVLDGHFEQLDLAWYAFYETDSFLNQIAMKVAPYQTPELTMLLDRLNRETLQA